MVLHNGPVIRYPHRVADDLLFRLGTDNDGVLLLRSTALAANTALTNVLVGTPVTPALAASSLIISNVTTDGDLMFAGSRAGNSEAYIHIDPSAGDLNLFRRGTGVVKVGAVGVPALHDVYVVNAIDTGFRVLRSTDSEVIARFSDVNSVISANTGAISLNTNGVPYLVIRNDGSVDLANTSPKLTLGTTQTFGTTQPTNTLVLFTGTAPAGAITTSVGLFTDGTVMRKIIAAGTVSNVET